MVFEIDFLGMSNKNSDDVEKLALLAKEGWLKSFLYDYHSQKQALSKFFLSALIQSDSIIEVIRRELRKISPDVKVTSDQIKEVIFKEVLKREVIEGEKADEAKKKINKVFNKISKNKVGKQSTLEAPEDKSAIVETNNEKIAI